MYCTLCGWGLGTRLTSLPLLTSWLCHPVMYMYLNINGAFLRITDADASFGKKKQQPPRRHGNHHSIVASLNELLLWSVLVCEGCMCEGVRGWACESVRECINTWTGECMNTWKSAHPSSLVILWRCSAHRHSLQDYCTLDITLLLGTGIIKHMCIK